MKHDTYYLVYYDEGLFSPMDLDDILLSWTTNLSVARLRAFYIKRRFDLVGEKERFLKSFTFRSYIEMKKFVENLSDDARYLDLDRFEVGIFETDPLTIGPHHLCVWTYDDISTGWETITNAYNDFRPIVICAGILYVCKLVLRDANIRDGINKLYERILAHQSLYKIAETFRDEIMQVDSGQVSDDFIRVRKGIMSTMGIDIAELDTDQYMFGLFDETRLLINLATMDTIIEGAIMNEK